MNRCPFPQPNGAVTGIGSLPHGDPARAVRFVESASPRVPFWPQLPARAPAEGMIPQMLPRLAPMIEPRDDRPGAHRLRASLDDALGALAERPAQLDVASAPGFFAFEQAVRRRRFPEARALKGQVTGPVTLGRCLSRGDRGDRPFADHPVLLGALADYVGRLAAWQAAQLRRFHLPVILFIDEPALHVGDETGPSEADAAEALRNVIAMARSGGALVGLHCCARMPERLVAHVQPDVLSFDAHGQPPGFHADRASRQQVKRGWVAYGLAPSEGEPSEPAARRLFGRWLAAASLTGDVRGMARRSMVTARCGLGAASEKRVVRSFAVAQRVGELIGQIASGDVAAPASHEAA